MIRIGWAYVPRQKWVPDADALLLQRALLAPPRLPPKIIVAWVRRLRLQFKLTV